MKERISSDQEYIHGLFGLIPAIIVNDEDPGLANLVHWEQKLPFHKSLPNEMERWKRLWQTKEMQGDIPNKLLKSLAVCDKDSFPNIHILLVIACTLPITSAEAERSFSLMRRLKTALRSTMAEEHLSDLAE